MYSVLSIGQQESGALAMLYVVHRTEQFIEVEDIMALLDFLCDVSKRFIQRPAEDGRVAIFWILNIHHKR